MYDLMSRDGVKFIIERVVQNASEVMRERESNPDSEYYAGMAQSCYETLDIIRNELLARGEDLKEYSLDGDLEKQYH